MTGPRLIRARASVIGPVLVVAVVLGLLIGSRLSFYHGDPAGFVLFGQRFLQYTHPPAGAPVNSPYGYDGQFYWIQATDPLLLRHATLVNLQATAPGYHLQRAAYPALAYALALGQRGALPWTLLSVNVFAVLGITAGFGIYVRRRGWSAWWAIAIGLMPGLLMPTLRDLSDPLATACMLGGVLAWQRGRRWWAGGLLAIAVLAREPMTLAVVAIAADAGARWWRLRRESGALRRAVAYAWPAVVVPAAAFVGWQIYIHGRYGANATAPSQPVLPPFKDFVEEVRQTLKNGPSIEPVWDIVYLALILTGMGAAFALLRREVTAAAVAGCLFALSLTVIVFGDQWGDTRYSAPMFGALLLGGLEARSRVTVGICVVTAAMSIFLPVVITGP